MGGMKSGTGDDPFDDPDDDVDVEGHVDGSPAADERETESETVTETEGTTADVPYVLARDRVQHAGRESIMVYRRDQTERAEDDALRDVEERLDDDIPLADLREAAMLVAYNRPDLLADELQEWGHGLNSEY